MAHRTINVTEFKAKCLALLDDVSKGSGTITVTKRGKPIATVGPARRSKWKSPEGALAGKVVIDDDLLMSDTSELWEVVREKRRARR